LRQKHELIGAAARFYLAQGQKINFRDQKGLSFIF